MSEVIFPDEQWDCSSNHELANMIGYDNICMHSGYEFDHEHETLLDEIDIESSLKAAGCRWYIDNNGSYVAFKIRS